MKKSFILFSMIACLFCACTSKTFTIKGEVNNDVEMVYFITAGENPAIIDSAEVVDGKFSITINKDSIPCRVLRTYGMGVARIPFFVDGKKVEIDIDDLKIEGDGLNKQWGELYEDYEAVDEKMQDLYARYAALLQMEEELQPEEFKEKMAGIDAEEEDLIELRRAITLRISDQYANTFLPVAAIIELDRGATYENFEYLLRPGTAYIDALELAGMKNYFEKLKLRQVGAKYIDFEMENMDGEVEKLSDYIGKGNVVLLDFWASWCGPCRREMPNVKACYDKYHEMGFDVVGISFDNNKAAWSGAVEKLELNWHHLSDLQGWSSLGAQVYGIRQIPSNILYDGEGIVLGSDLMGAELGNALAAIYEQVEM